MTDNSTRNKPVSEWKIVYTDFVPEKEKSRETLLTVGNGYVGVRGAVEESLASEIHYPGTYVAGLYNRLVSKVSGKDVENEDFVNCPNGFYMSFQIDGGAFVDLTKVKILSIHRELDFKTGVLDRKIIIEDSSGRQSEVHSQRLASMDNPHILASRYSVEPLNYKGRIRIKSGIDGLIINDGVERYRSLNQHHLKPLDSGREGQISWLTMVTTQSEIIIAQAVLHNCFIDDEAVEVLMQDDIAPGRITQYCEAEIEQNQKFVVEKRLCLYTSKEDDAVDPLQSTLNDLIPISSFEEIKKVSERKWKELWDQIDIRIEGNTNSQMLIRLHLYHLMVTASPHNVSIDAGVPARGLHGEAYRGHVFWDELYILPIYNLFLPDIGKSILRYRFRRLNEARKNAYEHQYEGSMFPWQSGSSGREETQVIHLNPLSGEWGDDYSSLQRHISIAIAYNVWYYFQVTDDLDFMKEEGAELFLDICRFWASKCHENVETGRFEIKKVMGPDEFHEEHPNSPGGGVKDNAYTNLMVSWLFLQAKKIWDQLGEDFQKALKEKIKISAGEIENWQNKAGKMHVEISKSGILAQFEGYFELEELDWDDYRNRYPNIYRLDRILKAEGKSPDDYKLAKQADTLMTFYNLDQHEIIGLLKNQGYSISDSLLSDNYRYYVDRTSHGSTLSRVVHAYLANEMNESVLAWQLYEEALKSDYNDIQGGTTAEGIHAGVMGGTVLMAITSFAGLNFKQDYLKISPKLPASWNGLSFGFAFRTHKYHIRIDREEVYLKIEGMEGEKVKVDISNKEILLQTNYVHRLKY